jgi:hypothetical protein
MAIHPLHGIFDGAYFLKPYAALPYFPRVIATVSIRSIEPRSIDEITFSCLNRV